MTLRTDFFVGSTVLALFAMACSSEAVIESRGSGGTTGSDVSGNGGSSARGGSAAQSNGTGGSTTGGSSGNNTGGATEPGAEELSVSVSATEATYVKLAEPGVVSVSDPQSSLAWDVAFVGYDVLTNGGLSGPGLAAAFGPLPVSVFAFPDQPVNAPFLVTDHAGGAFLGWYLYDQMTHVIYSRFHVYGIRSGGRFYKLQVLSYYGQMGGTTLTGLYQLRYAEVTASGSGKTTELHDLDATLGGATADADAPNTCLVLATGDTPRLSLHEAAASLDWDVCFRRDAISVNGENGGPGAVAAVDLEGADTADEAPDDVKARTADSEKALFDDVDYAALTAPGLEYRGDHVISAFTNQWLDPSADPPAPKPSTAFVVVGADGQSRYFLAFDAFDGADTSSPGTIHLGIEPTVSP